MNTTRTTLALISRLMCMGIALTTFPGYAQKAPKPAARQHSPAWPWQLPPGKNGNVTLLLMGDTNIQREKPEEAFQYLIPTLREADVRFVNLEGAFAGTSRDPRKVDIPHKARWTHSEPGMVKGLTAAGIDAVGVANNVTYPWEALMRSLAVLDSANIRYTGGGENLEAARKPVIIERQGVKFGFIQYTSLFWPFDHAAEPDRPGVAAIPVDTYYKVPVQLNDKPGQPLIPVTIPDTAAVRLMQENIRQLKQQADVVVASYHWGVSNTELVTDYQRTLARAAIDAGADLVMGHGPHVYQPIEEWKGKPIFFSLANAAFDWYRVKDRPDGLLVRVVVNDRKIVQVSCVPMLRNEANDLMLMDPNEGKGHELYGKLVRLGAESGARLRIEGKEIIVQEIPGGKSIGRR